MRMRAVNAMIFLAAGCLFSCEYSPHPAANIPLGNAVYVWQRAWSPDVNSALKRTAPATDTFMVLGVEYNVGQGRLVSHWPSIDWSAVAATTRPTIVVIRAHALPGIETNESRRLTVEEFAHTSKHLIESARTTGASVAGLQLDYDCATANLPHYHALIKSLRKELPDVPMSITALPTWLGQPGFEDIVNALDEYVLQVHSLETPKTIEDKATLCDPAPVPGWVDRAEQYRKPFYVALPTYGYELIYDGATGQFAGLRAEGREDRFANATVRELMADPVEIASIVNTLRSNPPPHMRGIAWFRLPVEGDRLNWTWPVLEGVMKGEVPKPDLVAEARSPEPGLYEIWIRNAGPIRPMKPIRVAVDWIHNGQMAHDALAGFTIDAKAGSSSGMLSGPSPRPGEEIMVAWFRFGEWDKEDGFRFDVGRVDIQP